jgi:hypothetical protein
LIEIDVNQPNHFFGIVKYDNQEISLHQAEEKYCCGRSIQQAQQGMDVLLTRQLGLLSVSKFLT